MKIERSEDNNKMKEIMRIKVELKRLIKIKKEKKKIYRFINIEDEVRIFIGRILKGYEVRGEGKLRIIRERDIEVEEEEEEIVRMLEKELKRRRRGKVIRIEFEGEIKEEMRILVEMEIGV